MKFNNVAIKAVSSYLPKKIITNKDIQTMGVNTTDEWVYDKLGIKQRCVASENELPSVPALNAPPVELAVLPQQGSAIPISVASLPSAVWFALLLSSSNTLT